MDNAGDMTVSESPWRQLNEDLDGDGHCIKAFRVASGRYMFCDIGNKFMWDADKEEVEKIRKPLANIVALSSAGKVKGAGYENVEYIVFDEFIPLMGTRDVKLDGFHLAQIVETVSRNREKNGLSPCKCICLANASTIANSVFMEFGLVNIVYNMVKDGYCRLDMPDRGIRVLLLPNTSSFVEEKKKTALYKALPKTSAMYRSSIDNEFTSDDFTDVVEKASIQGGKPFFIITATNGKMYTVYLLKDNKWRMEEGVKGNSKKAETFHLSSVSDAYLAENRVFNETWFDYRNGLMSFDSYETKVIYFSVVNKKMTPR